MGKEYLGELEELILTVVGILQDDAYGNAIIKEIKQQVNRVVSLAAAHVTLYRLEDKGYVKSRVGGATKTRGGRRKKIFTITNGGRAILPAMKEKRIKVWKYITRVGG